MYPLLYPIELPLSIVQYHLFNVNFSVLKEGPLFSNKVKQWFPYQYVALTELFGKRNKTMTRQDRTKHLLP